jgi:predicted acyl esterase
MIARTVEVRIRSSRLLAGLVSTAAVLIVLVLPPSALAAAAPFGHQCTPQNGVRFCPTTTLAQRVPSFDGVPLDVDVTLPPTATGPFPTIVLLHGWGGNKANFETTTASGDGNTTYHYNNIYYAQHGYAVLNYTARGFGNSCGSPSSRTADCASGWIHLADTRKEARDTQSLLGRLVKQGISRPNQIGVTGISYGGGQSLELAYLKNRVRNSNGTFTPWKSPSGVAMSISAAWPRWLWSDLVSSLLPNGRFLDTGVSGPMQSRNPPGVEIHSYVSGLYALGNATGYYAPAGADPEADISTWFAVTNAGEPYGDQAQAIADQIYTYHQGYGLTGTPAPLLLQSGWNDDLFPPEQSLRVYNALRAVNPSAPVSLQLGDIGHSRGSNKVNTDKAFQDQGANFFNARIRGSGTAPAAGSVTAYTQTCPKTAPGGGPYRAGSWAAIHPGKVLFGTSPSQTVTSDGGNPQTASAFDPIAGTSDACKTVPVETAPGTAVYSTTTSAGFTLLGLPTVTATINTVGPFGELASRLWDVAPDGTQRLISRGVYRLTDNQAGKITFQLHGNGYHFDAGHTVKLELLGSDAPYYRKSNGTFVIDVSKVTVSLPTTG